MPREPFQPQETPSPGPKMYVTLHIAEASLADLLAGQNVVRVWLEEDAPGVFSLHATRTMGEARKDEKIKPVNDKLVEIVNGFAEVLDMYAPEIPQAVTDAWDAAVDEWKAYGRV